MTRGKNTTAVHAALQSILLRRTKKVLANGLPRKREDLVHAEFDEDERARYVCTYVFIYIYMCMGYQDVL